MGCQITIRVRNERETEREVRLMKTPSPPRDGSTAAAGPGTLALSLPFKDSQQLSSNLKKEMFQMLTKGINL